MRRSVVLGCSIALAVGGAMPLTVDAAPSGGSLQSYIVVLDAGTRGVPAIAAEFAASHRGRVGHVYEHALSGFSITVPARAAAAIARDPRVAFVEADTPVQVEAQSMPTGIQRAFAASNTSIDIDGSDDYRVDVDVAVIDTGIDRQHPDLNVVGGINCAQGSPLSAKCSGDGDDNHYHGTHVAGTIGALDNGDGVVGMAPGARLWAVKVLNSQGSGYTSWIVAGIDWVAARADQIEVANMSLGGSGYSTAEYTAIQGAVNAGVAFAVAAGNSNADSTGFSPAAFDNVLTVSALADFNGAAGGGASSTCRSDVDDTLASFSNWGAPVDIAAPGVCILSTYPIEQGSFGTISGTSMASPHAAGALALLASVNNPANATDVAALYQSIRSSGNYNWTDDSGDGVKEPLLDVRTFSPTLIAGSGGGGGGGGGNAAPVASFITSCSSLVCTFTDTSTDSDGTIASRAWTSSTGATGSGTTFSVTFPAAGTYTVSLTVTDNGGTSTSTSRSVKVTTKRR